MKARVHLSLLKLTDPRVVRPLVLGLMLALTWLVHGSVAFADGCPEAAPDRQ
jgi:hypothetical protein